MPARKFKMPEHDKARNRSLPAAPVVGRGRPARKHTPREREAVRSLPSAPANYPRGVPPMTERRPIAWVPSSPIVSQGVKEAPKPPATPGTRRLRDLPRDITRPLECQLAALRRNPDLTEAEISQKLDLHPDDLGALARTCGQP